MNASSPRTGGARRRPHGRETEAALGARSAPDAAFLAALPAHAAVATTTIATGRRRRPESGIQPGVPMRGG